MTRKGTHILDHFLNILKFPLTKTFPKSKIRFFTFFFSFYLLNNDGNNECSIWMSLPSTIMSSSIASWFEFNYTNEFITNLRLGQSLHLSSLSLESIGPTCRSDGRCRDAVVGSRGGGWRAGWLTDGLTDTRWSWATVDEDSDTLATNIATEQAANGTQSSSVNIQ